MSLHDLNRELVEELAKELSRHALELLLKATQWRERLQYKFEVFV